jgi:hypothetical protein
MVQSGIRIASSDQFPVSFLDNPMHDVLFTQVEDNDISRDNQIERTGMNCEAIAVMEYSSHAESLVIDKPFFICIFI